MPKPNDISYTERLQGLRNEMLKRGLDAFILPATDEYLNEFVPASGRRLEWLTGFTGSAGMVAIVEEEAAFFTDGRYTLQAANELDSSLYTVYNIRDKSAAQWVIEHIGDDRRVGFDPHLHSVQQLAVMETVLEEGGKVACPTEPNPIDVLWKDRPHIPFSPVDIQEMRFAGESAHAKRARLCRHMQDEGIHTLLITAPDSLCWLLNIRGRDVPHTPLVLAVAILERSLDNPEGELTLFLDERRVESEVEAHLGEGVTLKRPADAAEVFHRLERKGKSVQLDPHTTTAWYTQKLKSLKCPLHYKPDPCQYMKAIKNPAEIAGMIAAHRRDGAALTRFLHWLEQEVPGGKVTELSATAALREFRAKQDNFVDISFESIAGFAANGAIVHYRVTEESNIPIKPNGLFLLDSGGQYHDGTTDVTRTMAIGTPTAEQKRRFTQVLRGHIALSQITFPAGTTGAQLDAVARSALWSEGYDYDHGTGHGVGSFLSVHEGPQRISKRGGDIALEAGMVLSNEPGFYKEGEYGIRIENLVRVVEREDLSHDRPFLGFEPLTLVPIDVRLVEASLLYEHEKKWLSDYHASISEQLAPLLGDEVKSWLKRVISLPEE